MVYKLYHRENHNMKRTFSEHQDLQELLQQIKIGIESADKTLHIKIEKCGGDPN